MGNNTQTNGWADVLKNKRKELGETQTVFGARFGVGAVAVSLWESGKREVPADVAWWLLKTALNIDDDGNILRPCDGTCINHPHLDRNGEITDGE